MSGPSSTQLSNSKPRTGLSCTCPWGLAIEAAIELPSSTTQFRMQFKVRLRPRLDAQFGRTGPAVAPWAPQGP
eukprot:11157385-Alexandrium_andersonii.AAC.1